MGFFKKKPDLGPAPSLSLDWSPEKATESLQKVFDHALGLANEAIGWYLHAKNGKGRFARRFRVVAIVLATIGALLPTAGELMADSFGTKPIRAGWTAILLGIVGALLLLDRFFGFSTGWMRYIAAELQLRQVAQEFQMDWEAERATWKGNAPTGEQILEMMARCKTFVSQVNTVVRDETNAWMKEFESALQQIDDAAKAKPAITEPGALNLTVLNGEASTAGWTLAIDDGKPETHQGKTAGKRNLMPGQHQLVVRGKIDGKAVQGEKVVLVPAGGTCEESLTLT
jgi:hypothetical protein